MNSAENAKLHMVKEKTDTISTRVYTRKPDGSWECSRRTVKQSGSKNSTEKEFSLWDGIPKRNLTFGDNHSMDKLEKEYRELYAALKAKHPR